MLVHTSGSTGKPKPLMVEKKRMLNSARITCDFLGLKPGDTALLCMSLDYIAGKMVVVRSIERQLQLIAVKPSGHPLSDESLAGAKGSEVKVSDSLSGVKGLGTITSDAKGECDENITFAAMVPIQVYNTLQVPEERERLARIKHLIIGGGAIDEALAKELNDMSEEFRKEHGYENAIWSTYGMTETLSHIALRRINGKEASDWYTPFDSVKISQTEEGCLVIDAPLVCDKPLVTNDIVEIKEAESTQSSYIYNKVEHAGLCFRIKGRKDNVICSGGIKIQIEEVEALLKPYLDKPFMLAKKKDEKFGEIAVLLTEDSDIKTIEATVRRLLSDEPVKDSAIGDTFAQKSAKKYWIPREYMHVEHLPLTETGKPKRSCLESCKYQVSNKQSGFTPAQTTAD